MITDRIDRYEVKSVLGQGGMATVYLAHDPRFKRDVAIKVMPEQLLNSPVFRARFEREAQIIAALEHPAIVPVYDFGEHEGQPYLVMRYMPGGSLADRLANGPMTLQEVSRILARLAPALDTVHEHGIVHRDLKPANILFDQYGNACLSDFGIARLAQATTTLTGEAVIGTPAYMSPEQVRGEAELDGRSDIYALGAIVFEMLTGQQPFQSTTPMGVALKQITDPVPDIRKMKADLPDEVEFVIECAMAKEREIRYQTASAMAETVEGITSRIGRAAGAMLYPEPQDPPSAPQVHPAPAPQAFTPQPGRVAPAVPPAAPEPTPALPPSSPLTAPSAPAQPVSPPTTPPVSAPAPTPVAGTSPAGFPSPAAGLTPQPSQSPVAPPRLGGHSPIPARQPLPIQSTPASSPPAEPKRKPRGMAFASGGVLLFLGLCAGACLIVFALYKIGQSGILAGASATATPYVAGLDGATEASAGELTSPIMTEAPAGQTTAPQSNDLDLVTTLPDHTPPQQTRQEDVFFDDFEYDNSGWTVENITEAWVGYDGGNYRIQVRRPNIIAWGVPNVVFDDVRVQVEASKVSGADENFFGVVCRHVDDQNFYLLGISSDGYYAITRMRDGVWELIKQDYFVYHPDVHQGETTNRLMVECIGNQLALLANETLLAEVELKGEYLERGGVGLAAVVFSVGETNILFDNFFAEIP